MNNSLYHHGILGMKWGIRRYQNSDGSLTKAGQKRYSSVDTVVSKKNGDKLYLNRHKKSLDRDYDIVQNGKKVGNLFLEDHGDDLYVNWIDIKKSQRGKGYASAVMDYVIKSATKEGFKAVTLEVPEGDDDARHIYEKHGFIAGKTDEYDLTKMRRKL